MPLSSPRFSRRTRPAHALIAALLLGVAPGCARPTTAGQPEPDVGLVPGTSPTVEGNSVVIEKRPDEPLASLLRRAPGVQVTENADGSISVRIRAASSFYASSEPLWVIDGSPVTPEPGGTLRGINPHDIQSIQVLLYPQDTALYGVRGANGVILITTIRPRR